MSTIAWALSELWLKICEKTKWLPVGHIWSHDIINQFIHCSHYALCLYQVWIQLVKSCLSYSWKYVKKTKWPSVGHIGLDRKINRRAYVSHSALSLYQVSTKSDQPCLRNSSGRTHARTDARTHARTDRTQSISPPGLRPAGTNSPVNLRDFGT